MYFYKIQNTKSLNFPKNLGRPFQKFFGRPSAAGPTKHLYDPPTHLHRHPI